MAGKNIDFEGILWKYGFQSDTSRDILSLLFINKLRIYLPKMFELRRLKDFDIDYFLEQFEWISYELSIDENIEKQADLSMKEIIHKKEELMKLPYINELYPYFINTYGEAALVNNYIDLTKDVLNELNSVTLKNHIKLVDEFIDDEDYLEFEVEIFKKLKEFLLA